jgi:hypothetical protein
MGMRLIIIILIGVPLEDFLCHVDELQTLLTDAWPAFWII